MQNPCHNRLTIFADDPDQITNFTAAVAGPDQSLDFEVIAPVPAILDKVIMGLQSADDDRDGLVIGASYFEEALDGTVKERPLTTAEWDDTGRLAISTTRRGLAPTGAASGRQPKAIWSKAKHPRSDCHINLRAIAHIQTMA